VCISRKQNWTLVVFIIEKQIAVYVVTALSKKDKGEFIVIDFDLLI